MVSTVERKTIVSVSSSVDEIDQILLNIRGRDIFFESSEWVNPSCDFAIWVSLPIAMRFGGTLQINGSTSERARKNAEDLSLIWSTWMPKLFRPIRVQSEGYIEAKSVKSDAKKSLMLYSGGVDSTFALKRYVDEGNEPPDLLMIHGMDYRRSDHERFQRLKDRTAPFREKNAGKSIEVRSNAASVMRRFGVSSAIGHGFQLFSSLFLFDYSHQNGLIAADFNFAQDILTVPWGTNSLTNPMFTGNRMQITTLANDMTRGEKLKILNKDKIALNTLSFCKNYSIRPNNCGTCSKCVRTKAMFHAAGLDIPDIFLIGGFNVTDLRFLDLSKSIEVAFCLDVLKLARASGRESDFSIISKQLFSKKQKTKIGRLFRWTEGYLRGIKAKN